MQLLTENMLDEFDFPALDKLRKSLQLSISDVCYEGRINRSCYFRWEQHYKGLEKGAKPNKGSLVKMRKALIALQLSQTDQDPDPPPEEEEEPPLLDFIQRTAAG